MGFVRMLEHSIPDDSNLYDCCRQEDAIHKSQAAEYDLVQHIQSFGRDRVISLEDQGIMPKEHKRRICRSLDNHSGPHFVMKRKSSACQGAH